MSQHETLPGTQNNISSYEENKIIYLAKGFLNRDNFCPDEALRLNNFTVNLQFNGICYNAQICWLFVGLKGISF